MKTLFPELNIKTRKVKALGWEQIRQARPGYIPEKKKRIAYNKFTLEEVVRKFGLKTHLVQDIVGEVPPYQPSDFLKTSLTRGLLKGVQIGTEKARSEFIVAPILLELQYIFQNQVSLFSGTDFTIDKQLGLSGTCDFIFSLGSEPEFLTAPAVTIVEAKNDIIKNGLGQCAAEMVAAQIFNQKNESNIKTVYGVVTTGVLWRFLKLEGSNLYMEKIEKAYTITDNNIDKLLGIFIKMLEKQPAAKHKND